MRWFMLPVSAAAHVAAFLVTLIVPLATGVEAPTPWPLSSVPEFVAAAPVPPPPVLRQVSSVARTDVAPTKAPDYIGPPLPAETVIGPAVDGAGDNLGTPSGVIADLPIDGFTAPPVVLSLPPAPAPPAAYRPGGVIKEPRKLVDVAPIYPDIARAARVEGLVILEATIDERGSVIGARVLRSVPLLDAAALGALKQWRYTPTLLNGTPVRVLMTVTFRFSLAARDETPAAFGATLAFHHGLLSDREL